MNYNRQLTPSQGTSPHPVLYNKIRYVVQTRAFSTFLYDSTIQSGREGYWIELLRQFTTGSPITFEDGRVVQATGKSWFGLTYTSPATQAALRAALQIADSGRYPELVLQPALVHPALDEHDESLIMRCVQMSHIGTMTTKVYYPDLGPVDAGEYPGFRSGVLTFPKLDAAALGDLAYRNVDLAGIETLVRAIGGGDLESDMVAIFNIGLHKGMAEKTLKGMDEETRRKFVALFAKYNIKSKAQGPLDVTIGRLMAIFGALAHRELIGHWGRGQGILISAQQMFQLTDAEVIGMTTLGLGCLTGRAHALFSTLQAVLMESFTSKPGESSVAARARTNSTLSVMAKGRLESARAVVGEVAELSDERYSAIVRTVLRILVSKFGMKQEDAIESATAQTLGVVVTKKGKTFDDLYTIAA